MLPYRYIAWNLHEEIKGQFKFDGNLDIEAFIKVAQELGLYVILRPGPYICSEWDFGGLPSWLLNDPNMQPRSMYPPFVEAGDRFFKKLLPIVAPLQYSKGGPIIAFQIENEYGSYPGADVKYLEHLKTIMINEGITELLFTSDNYLGLEKELLSMPNVLKTINFGVQKDAKLQLVQLKEKQPDKPVMVTEYWLGWFDQWGRQHRVRDAKAAGDIMEEILKFGASVNLYMFHGGTNFGFMNGANDLVPVTTSYDYDGPLSEAGDTTPKYHTIKAIIEQYAPEHSIPEKRPRVPVNSQKMDYGKVKIQQIMSLTQLLQYHTPVESDDVMPMEQLPINNNGGQGYGFILYQTELPHLPKEIVIEQVLDRAQVLLDNLLIYTYDASVEYKSPVRVAVNKHLTQPVIDRLLESKNVKLEILVENMGRTNIGWDIKKLRKGINGKVKIDDQSQTKWRVYPLEFKQDALSRIKEQGKWNDMGQDKVTQGPTLYKGTFEINDKPKDTFLNMENWTKGVCFINGHNLGRYWIKGPQQTLYVPAPWLQKGENELIIFEVHNYKSAEVSFTTSPIYELKE
ncbi:hypothetical protein ACROYT_G026909 [Oculina patagonica]